MDFPGISHGKVGSLSLRFRKYRCDFLGKIRSGMLISSNVRRNYPFKFILLDLANHSGKNSDSMSLFFNISDVLTEIPGVHLLSEINPFSIYIRNN